MIDEPTWPIVDRRKQNMHTVRRASRLVYHAIWLAGSAVALAVAWLIWVPVTTVVATRHPLPVVGTTQMGGRLIDLTLRVEYCKYYDRRSVARRELVEFNTPVGRVPRRVGLAEVSHRLPVPNTTDRCGGVVELVEPVLVVVPPGQWIMRLEMAYGWTDTIHTNPKVFESEPFTVSEQQLVTFR